MKLDYIVVGAGIAGCCISWELMNRNKRVAIFDELKLGSSSEVAAGVINPITGMRLVKSWRSELAHPYAKHFYAALETKLHSKFFHQKKILQLCKSPEERELWLKRAQELNYAEFVEEHNPPETFAELNDNFGSFVIGRSAWVEPKKSLEAFHKYFEEAGVLHRQKVDFAELKISDNSISFAGFDCEKIIFCDGWNAISNPFFSWLPYRPAKGEILTFYSSIKIPEHVIHRGEWIMKCGENLFRMGSTWDRENLNSTPTDSARERLCALLKNILPNCKDAKVVEHSAGVRPCTATTRPHLGAHPDNPSILSFNGFGSKGFALSPYFAKHFADFLENGVALDSEANLARHIRKFFKRDSVNL